MKSIDPTRLDLAHEFKQNPIGPHSPDLQQLLKLMRWDHATERYTAVQLERGGKWRLMRATGPKASPLKVYKRLYDSVEQAQWAIFRARWTEHTGQSLILGDDDGDNPAAGEYELSTNLVCQPILLSVWWLRLLD